MLEVRGKYNIAKVYANIIENKAREQIKELCDQIAFKGSKIRIMPDVHAGLGCVIGFTADMGTRIIPNLIGVDIGCGVSVAGLGSTNINFKELDEFIRKEIPSGNKVRKEALAIEESFREEIRYLAKRIDNLDKLQYHYCSIGTLGGGNHFIEIDKDEANNFYLLVHSGSRNLGNVTANYFQKEAVKYCKQKRQHDILKKQESIYNVPGYFSFLEGALAQDYLKCMKIAQKFASLNRDKIIEKICNGFLGIEKYDYFTTIHNYIDETGMIRKGAVSAQEGEKLIIPINMRDGAVIAAGKGCAEWNYSAPHGAGRTMSRTQADRTLSMEDFKSSMAGIYTTSISKNTLDEAPMAYKDIDEILYLISETVDILHLIKPVYNFKAAN